MQKNNRGIVLIEALLIMSIIGLWGLVNTNKNLKEVNEDHHQQIEKCEKLQDFVNYQNNKKYNK